MKVFSRILILLLVTALLFALALSGCSNKEPAPTEAPSPSVEPAETSSVSPEPTGEPAETDEPAPVEPAPSEPSEDPSPAETASPEPVSVQYDLDGDKKADYSFDSGLLNYEYKRDGDTETYIIGGAEVSFCLIAGKDAASAAPGFADRYLDYVSVEYPGVSSMGDSGLRGECINAKNEQQQFSAWLIDTPNGVLAISVLAPLDASLNGAFALLDSVKLL